MTNNTIKNMKTYEVEGDELQKQHVIHLGKQEIMLQHRNKHSLLDLLLSSIQFTRLHTWCFQLALLLLTTILITGVIHEESSVFIIQTLTVIVIFSVIFFIDEVVRSFTSGMWELEQTLKYDLRQHTIIKLLIFGLADLLLIVCLAYISQGVLAISFLKIILYLLVPFNISCIVLFSLFTVWRNTRSSVVFWGSSGIVLVGFLFITNLFNVYEWNVTYWIAGYMLSIPCLLFFIRENLKVTKWEAFLNAA
ncbi:hypothetical protein [Rossellomorea vietnamensis]|uniref:hypothetical protein n=1 Tax=Rossellomorea vietnamensis TaxID=218284 RepID=UPI001E316D7E|nr:hypothetical protein [Rossellomorea vietnamensis]MCC5804355.1 hypothetical protein [Rossellomorea vietnamensis]